jgi:hypothetical protein
MTALLLLYALAQSPPTSGEWRFSVRHDHAFGSCHGDLIMSDESIRYEAADGKHVWQWTYPEIAEIEISSDREIRLHSYQSEGMLKLWSDRDFRFTFEDASDGEARVGPEVYAFLEARSPRPVRTRIAFDTADAARVVQQLPARHDHVLGSCRGTLTILEDRIVYRTEHEGDSRTWPLGDIVSFASTGDFDLRVSTAGETFRFELQLPLMEATYRRIWERVYLPGARLEEGVR